MSKLLYRYLFAVFLPLILPFTLVFGQELVKGYVYDSDTNEVVEYANVIVAGTHNGTTTNENGYFEIEVNGNDRFLNISFIGYELKEVTISLTKTMKVLLSPDAAVLDEVVVVGDNKKENPAHNILRRIRKNHSKYSLKQSKTYSYDRYDKVRFDLYDPDSTLKHLGPFKGFDEIVSRKYTKGDFTYVPLLLIEEAYKVYGKNKPNKLLEVLEANNTSGFKNNESVSAYLRELYLNYSVFDNTITLFNKKFTSPLSSRALLTYKYAIVDSAYYGKDLVYKIQYFPRRKSELTFEGSFWADTTKYVIHSIDLHATKGFNVNFVNDIFIHQQFKEVKNNLITVTKDSLSLDFTPFKSNRIIGATAVKVTNYYNHELNKMTPISFAKSNKAKDDEPFIKTSDEWKKIRPVSLGSNDEGIYNMHDELKQNNKFMFYRDVAEVLQSGWYNHGKLDYGPYYNIIGYNEIEGLRLQVGARTYFGRNDLWRIGGYTAYGFQDKDFKFGLGFSYLFSQNNRWIFSLGIKDDLEQRGVLLSQENHVYSKNYASSLFTIGDNSKLTNTVSYRLGVETEPLNNLRIKFSTKYDYMTSISGFNMAYLDPNTGEELNRLDDFQMQLAFIYTPNRKNIGYGVDRAYVTNWHPTFRVKYVKGVAGFIDSAFDYHKVKLYVRYPFLTGVFGKTIAITELGKTFGTVPLQLMDIIPGNQTISIEGNMFSMMNYYEFVSDTYATLHLDHHFNGRIFSKVPGANKLDLRAVVGFRAGWGDILNKENIAINRSEINYLAPTDGYFEYSAGIENIFKILRIDGVWRTSYLSNPNSNPFGVRFRLKLLF